MSRRGHAVDEEMAVEVVQLVLDGTGLEGVGPELELLTVGSETFDHHLLGADDVTRQVGDAHASLPRSDRAMGDDEPGIHDHELTVTGTGLGVTGHVHTEDAESHSDLRCCNSYRMCCLAHRVEEITADCSHGVVDHLHRLRWSREDVRGREYDVTLQRASHEIGFGRVHVAVDTELSRASVERGGEASHVDIAGYGHVDRHHVQR